MSATPALFFEDLVQDILANNFILAAGVGMTVLFLLGARRIQQRGAADPLAHTISEAMPVLGLMGTFVGALYIFYFAKDDGLDGVVVAFAVSFLGWFYYTIMQFHGAVKSKTSSQVLEENLEKTQAMGDAVEKLDAKLASSLEQFIRINEVLQDITQTAGLSSIEQLEKASANCNEQLHSAAENIAACAVNMERLGKQAEKPIELNIQPPSDVQSLTRELEQVAGIFERIQGIERNHTFKLDVPEQLGVYQNQLSELSLALEKINQQNKDVAVNVSLAGDTRRVNDALSELSQSLHDFEQAPKHHEVTVEVGSDMVVVNEFRAAVQELSVLQKRMEFEIGVSLAEDVDAALQCAQSVQETLQQIQGSAKSLGMSPSSFERAESKPNSRKGLFSVFKRN